METYNGWKNRSTWLVVLHIDNTEGLAEHIQDVIKNGFDPLGATTRTIVYSNTKVKSEQGFNRDEVDWKEVIERYHT